MPVRPSATTGPDEHRGGRQMAERFRAVLVSKDDDKGQSVATTQMGPEDLVEGDVTVAVSHSTVNYKDGLAITGKMPVIRKFPMIPGIDFTGTVEASEHSDFNPGDAVILNGWGVGEVHYGG